MSKVQETEERDRDGGLWATEDFHCVKFRLMYTPSTTPTSFQVIIPKSYSNLII